MSEMLEFTPSKARRFKEVYQDTLEHHRQSFIFEGHEFLTDYAKYVIEYLESRFKIKKEG